jgi:hypothetical protein
VTTLHDNAHSIAERRISNSAQTRAPYGTPLVNADVPALSAPEFSELTGIATCRLNAAVRGRGGPGLFFDHDGRPCVELAKVAALREWFGHA